MIIRKADKRDEYNIYILANDPEVRKYSFNSIRIKYEDHIEWFANQINDEKILFLVSYIKNDLAGQIRFKLEDSEAIVSVSISPEFRGKGYGQKFMQEAIELLKHHKPHLKKIKAMIKKENVASIDYFKKCNYKYTGALIIDAHESFLYEYGMQG